MSVEFKDFDVCLYAIQAHVYVLGTFPLVLRATK